MLMGKPGRVFTREELTSSVWGYAPMAGNRTIDVHIAQLKAKSVVTRVERVNG